MCVYVCVCVSMRERREREERDYLSYLHIAAVLRSLTLCINIDRLRLAGPGPGVRWYRSPASCARQHHSAPYQY